MKQAWLITKSRFEINDYPQVISLKGSYDFYYSLDKNSYYYDKGNNSGIFVFGYCLPRLSNKRITWTPEELFFSLTKRNVDIKNIIKGVFTIILIENGRFSILNDHFGLSKFFYTRSEEFVSFSNSLKQLKVLISNTKLSSKNILEYYVFNYLLNGHTFFENIFYSTPAFFFSMDDNLNIKRETYFNIIDYLKSSKISIKGMQVYERATDIWMDIIDQYQQALNNSHVSLTLTAGLDSRIILGSFLKSQYAFYDTFTFGHERSSDVHYAKKLAKDYRFDHRHLYPNNHFFENFIQFANNVYTKGETLVSIYRAHRLDAYIKVLDRSHAVFMGLGGSDLVRGIGYDGLIVSPIAFHCWKKNPFEEYFMNNKLSEHYKKLGLNSFDYILDNKTCYEFITHPLSYLFKVVIPLHFGQDFMINQQIELKTFVPFLDIDYIDFIKGTEYMQLTDYKNFTHYNLISRAKGLYYSAKLLKKLNNDLSKFSLGKGYTPNDIVNFFPIIYLKNQIYKKSNFARNNVANFSYGKWFNTFIKNYFVNNDINRCGLNKEAFNKKFSALNYEGGELDFLDFTKAVNVDMAYKL